jgi:hypothetical protein
MLPFGLSGPSKKRAISIVALVLGGAAAQTVMLLASRHLRIDADIMMAAAQDTNPTASALAIGLTAILELFCALAWLNARAMSD